MTTPSTPPVVLAQRVGFSWQRIKPPVWFWAFFAIFAVIFGIAAIRTGQPLGLLLAPGLTVLLWLFYVWFAVKPTDGSAWADPAGVHWSGKFGSYSYAWPQIDWIELARDQPGARFFNRVAPNSNSRNGNRIGITVVVDTVPHYIHPVWSAANDARIPFGCALAAYARAQGVRVRVLQGDWGAENANREPVRL